MAHFCRLLVICCTYDHDNADTVEPDMRFKFVDDLSVLELVMLASLLSEYNFKQHVASDVGIDELYVSPDNLTTQSVLNNISSWTQANKMKLNEEKTKYMICSRSGTEMATRLTVNGQTLDRVEAVKVVGVWLTTWLDWERNTSEICRKSYARVIMITKLKYAGVSTVDLININILYIRSVLEYCSVLWHSTLTVDQSQRIERVQKTCLKIILGTEYNNYGDALECTGLEKLSDRRENRCLQFGLKCLLHPVHQRMFPVNPQLFDDPQQFDDQLEV